MDRLEVELPKNTVRGGEVSASREQLEDLDGVFGQVP
jgi:hypothetical protein